MQEQSWAESNEIDEESFKELSTIKNSRKEHSFDENQSFDPIVSRFNNLKYSSAEK